MCYGTERKFLLFVAPTPAALARYLLRSERNFLPENACFASGFAMRRVVGICTHIIENDGAISRHLSRKRGTALQNLMEATYTENQSRRPQDGRTTAQMEALDKLVALLEGRTGQAPDASLRHSVKPNPLSQLARLKAAHAAYALGSSEMERVTDGAYLNRQHIVD